MNVEGLKGIKLIHLNIGSLLPKFTLLSHDFLDNSFDAIAISETWLKQCVPDSLINVSGYNVIRKDRIALCHTRNGQRAKIKGCGGICLYLKNDMIYETWNSVKNDCVDLELLTAKTSRGGGKKQVITVVYRPPNCNPTTAIDYVKLCERLA